ncbi:MAG: response regulator [Nitrospinota bacterium]
MAADLRAREDELRKEKANLKALLTASAKITSVLELDEALKAILDEATRTLSDRCSIYLFDAEKDEIRDLGDKGLSKDFLETMNLRWRRLPRQRALTQGEPVVIRDAANDLRQAAIRDAVIREGYRSLAIFPLRSRGTTIGGMNFYFDTPQDFGEEQLSLCRAFASQTAIAIANSQLFDRLALEKHRLSAIPDSSNQGIMMVDVSGNVVLVNRWMTNLFQLRATGTIEEREEFLSRCFSDPEAFLRKTLRLFEDPEATADEVFEIDLPDHRILRRFSAPVRDEKEKIIGRLFVYRDITKEQQIERMKNEFISVVSHEIRTPLTSLRGSLGLLAAGMAGELQPQGQELLEIAVNNCDRLIRLINDILDLEKIEAGKMELHIAPCSLEELVARSVNEMQGFADGHEVTLETDLPPCQVSADADRVVQVLTNLLSNAVKFSEAGGRVTVGARLVEADVEVRVEDRGRGIPASAIENVFGKFQQVDASDSRQKGGTGLGLAICQAIVSQHGGRIWVESEEGVGSTFFFTLPLTAASAAEPAPEPRAAGAPRVLVCDDDRDFVRLLQLLLNQAGYEVLPAYSGEEALETLSRTEVNAVLLDVRLPKMSGPDVLREIKSRPETASLPVIIVSGLPPSELEDVPTPLVLDWLTKPLDEARLLRRLREAARRASRPTVLLVDDDQGLLDLLTRLLNQVSPDVRVRTAEGGRQAVEICRREMPSLIVLDILMPDGDGFFVIDALREDLALRRIPVVVYSAVEPNEEDRRRLTVGTTQFLTKSKVKEEDFASQVIELLNGLLPAGVGGERGGGFLGRPEDPVHRL